jgi:hypothetical protein
MPEESINLIIFIIVLLAFMGAYEYVTSEKGQYSRFAYFIHNIFNMF